tara:strand:- start:375 stop:623 length:249 start_codon:yes stop_codon:yes gene_type:complete
LINNFYETVQKVSEEADDLSETAKAVVLFRVALENHAREVGLESSMYLMSKLMTTTLGIMAGEEESFEQILPDLNENDMTSH